VYKTEARWSGDGRSEEIFRIARSIRREQAIASVVGLANTDPFADQYNHMGLQFHLWKEAWFRRGQTIYIQKSLSGCQIENIVEAALYTDCLRHPALVAIRIPIN